MSANKKKSVLDQLIDAGSDSDSEDDQQVGSGAAADAGKQPESAGSGSDGEEETAAAKRAKKAAISLEDLQRAGYNSGPSVLLMKAPQEQQEQQWNWCVAMRGTCCACMGVQEQEQLRNRGVLVQAWGHDQVSCMGVRMARGQRQEMHA